MAGRKKMTQSSGACVYRLTGSSAEILLIKSNRNPTWGIPKGHVDPGEDIVDACHREVFEEAGIYVHLEDKLPTVTTINDTEIKDVHSWVATQVGDDEPTGELDPDAEVDDIQWFDIEELPPIHRYLVPAIANAVDIIRQKLA